MWVWHALSISVRTSTHADQSIRERHNKTLDVCVSNSVRFNRTHSTMVLAGLFGAFSGFGIAMMTNATRKIPLSRGDYIVKSFCWLVCPSVRHLLAHIFCSTSIRTLEPRHVHRCRLLGWRKICQDREETGRRYQPDPC